MSPLLESSSVHKYLDILQSMVSRLANNSASCKQWCLTIVAAVMVFALDKGKPEAILAALLPIIAFFWMDAYYLALERDVRATYSAFIEMARDEDDTRVMEAIYRISIPKGFWVRA